MKDRKENETDLNQSMELELDFTPTSEDLKWLRSGGLDPLVLKGVYVPRNTFRNIVIRSVCCAILCFPVVPMIVNRIWGPSQRRAQIEQISPDPEKRTPHIRTLEFDLITPIIIGELLVLGVWAVLVVPDLIKVVKFYKTYN